MSSFEDMRGPPRGLARAHRGLAAFWQEFEAGDEGQLGARLTAWLEGDAPVALAVGHTPARRSQVALWAHEVLTSGQAQVVFVPLSALYGTVTIRDVLGLSFALLPNSEGAAFSVPRNMHELRAAMRLALQGVGWVSSLPDEEDPQLLWVLEGADSLADGDISKLLDVHGLGEGARVLLAVEDAESVRPHVGDVLALVCAGDAAEEGASDGGGSERGASEAGASERSGSSTPTSAGLNLLSVALAPFAAEDFSALGAAPPDDARVLVDDGHWRFASHATREAWPCDRHAVEMAIIESVWSRMDQSLSPYLIAYASAHMVRQGASLSRWKPLVTPAWMQHWMRTPGWLVGFASDVEHARAAAVRSLADDVTAATLAFVVRTVLVQASLFSKEGSRSRERDRSEPYCWPEVDLDTPTGADEARAVALATLAAALNDPTLATTIAPADAQPTTVPAIRPKPANDDDTKLVRNSAPDAIGKLLARLDPPSLAGLTSSEIIEAIASTEDVYRVTAFAVAAAYVTEAERPALVRTALIAYREHGDEDCQRAILALAPWMTKDDALSLFCELTAGDWGATLTDRLTGWAGVTDLIGLLQRLAGDHALVAVAREIEDVAAWLP